MHTSLGHVQNRIVELYLIFLCFNANVVGLNFVVFILLKVVLKFGELDLALY